MPQYKVILISEICEKLAMFRTTLYRYLQNEVRR